MLTQVQTITALDLATVETSGVLAVVTPQVIAIPVAEISAALDPKIGGHWRSSESMYDICSFNRMILD